MYSCKKLLLATIHQVFLKINIEFKITGSRSNYRNDLN